MEIKETKEKRIESSFWLQITCGRSESKLGVASFHSDGGSLRGIGVFGWRESLGIEGKMTWKKLGAAVEALYQRRF